MGYQQVYCNPAKLDEIYRRFPAHKLQVKHQNLKPGDVFEFQFDAVVYSIKVGEQKVFPADVARMAVKQATYGMAELVGEPISFVEFVGESHSGAINPLACPAPGCTFQAIDLGKLGDHLTRKHKIDEAPEKISAPAASIGASAR